MADGVAVGELDVVGGVVDALGVVRGAAVDGAEDRTDECAADDGGAEVSLGTNGALTVAEPAGAALVGAALVGGGCLALVGAVVGAGGAGCWTRATWVFGEWLGTAELGATLAAARVAAEAGDEDGTDGWLGAAATFASPSLDVAGPASAPCWSTAGDDEPAAGDDEGASAPSRIAIAFRSACTESCPSCDSIFDSTVSADDSAALARGISPLTRASCASTSACWADCCAFTESARSDQSSSVTGQSASPGWAVLAPIAVVAPSSSAIEAAMPVAACQERWRRLRRESGSSHSVARRTARPCGTPGSSGSRQSARHCCRIASTGTSSKMSRPDPSRSSRASSDTTAWISALRSVARVIRRPPPNHPSRPEIRRPR